MSDKKRAIIRQQSPPLSPYVRRPNGSIDNFQPLVPITQHRPSHYLPVILRSHRTDNGLSEVVKVFVYGGVILMGFSMVALSIVHFGNAIYWQGERMHQRVQPGYLGGSWND